MKVGRNDPCPCGSGKKYKKCCINKPIDTQPEPKKPQFKKRWTDEAVEKMSTPEIFSKLREIGVKTDEHTFVEHIKTKNASEDLALEWKKNFHLNINDFSIDFVFIAARVLAGRLAPDHLLIENLDSMMQEGYSLFEKGREDEACDLWWDLWQKTLKWIPPRKVASIKELDKITSPYMMQSYHNWVQDFEMALSQIGQKDARFLEILHQYATEFRKLFPKSESLILMNMGTAAGEALCQLDRLDEANALFEQLTNEKYEDEDMVWVYLRWGDLYTEWINGGIIDHNRARGLYEKALELKLNESDRESVLERIEDLEDGE